MTNTIITITIVCGVWVAYCVWSMTTSLISMRWSKRARRHYEASTSLLNHPENYEASQSHYEVGNAMSAISKRWGRRDPLKQVIYRIMDRKDAKRNAVSDHD